jgi:hypothetical protein
MIQAPSASSLAPSSSRPSSRSRFARTAIEQQHAHLMEVGLQHRLFCRLFLYCAVARGPLVLDPLLAYVLLHRQPEPDEGQRERNHRWLQSVPDQLPA